ncbi:MAG: uracil-DNA glycosylase [Erysipelotrichaceae bacterium]|jgi:uracil-DNA glycosylase|nr:uracil-DNA glycosylase [Erysipelotrichaceae bacterium]MBR6957400.1 uracil-DNA glycosylase [Erysipelotrichaceae bacterium]
MINKSWDEFLNREFEQDYFRKLSAFLKQEYAEKTIYPPKQEVFSAFYYTDLDKVKVVILGQDPYHEPNQACGMCFAVKPGNPLPKSLINIYREIHDDLGLNMSTNGYLVKWATQGVLLINTVLTVERGKANSHKGRGWEEFTDHVIQLLNRQDQPIVFLLWGNNARAKMSLLNNPRHLVLTAAHPSPLSAYNGFFGCRHFSRTNEFLEKNGVKPIDWKM